MSTEPRPPENVRIVRRDGTEIPCEVRYLGRDEDGLDEWEAVTEYAMQIREGDTLWIDVFPAKCSVTVRAVAR